MARHQDELGTSVVDAPKRADRKLVLEEAGLVG